LADKIGGTKKDWRLVIALAWFQGQMSVKGILCKLRTSLTYHFVATAKRHRIIRDEENPAITSLPATFATRRKLRPVVLT
jgi:hypothetical protein